MPSSAVSFVPTKTDIERYRHLRAASKNLNHKIIDTLPKNAMREVGKLLCILHGRTFVLGSQDELSVIMDCCLYDLIRDGKNAIQRYAENHAPAPGTEEHELLQAYLGACYRIVIPSSRIEGAGAYFVDLLTREELFVMDFGMSQTPLDIAYATRTIPLGPFWMTGGAGLPAGCQAINETIARLNNEDLLRNDGFTDPHRATLTIVQTLLEEGASEHIEYQDLPPSRFEGRSRPARREK